MIYYTADTHFDDVGAITFYNRPFKNVSEMNKAIIERWNQRVQDDDTVYILGDMFFDANNAENILKCLRGKKYLIIGNHDDLWMNSLNLDKYFNGVNLILEINIGNDNAVMCHYPMLSWNNVFNTYMIHGHIHNNTMADYFPFILKRNTILNAGVDINKFTPVTFDELIDK